MQYENQAPASILRARGGSSQVDVPLVEIGVYSPRTRR